MVNIDAMSLTGTTRLRITARPRWYALITASVPWPSASGAKVCTIQPDNQAGERQHDEQHPRVERGESQVAAADSPCPGNVETDHIAEQDRAQPVDPPGEEGRAESCNTARPVPRTPPIDPKL